MRRKLLLAILGLMLVLGLAGCSFKPKHFVGAWVSDDGNTLTIYDDYTFTHGKTLVLLGKWSHNGDNTITINPGDYETIATKLRDREKHESYLLWRENKYYKSN